ncbi:MAG: Crp/Fnr family transcriptional regulator [Deltaproteobacteria bacterium]|nr:Crp/Fnr family transcriptional regulator [Deltaproteobacteria bacterium]
MKERNEALRGIPLFRNLDEKDLADIAGLLIDRKFPRDAVILEDGSLGDYMYLIQEGQVKVTKMSEDGREKILEMLGPGDFFGEMALLDREPRSASVKTTTACVLLALSRMDFLGLLKQDHELTLELLRELARRIRETDEQIRGLSFERVESRARRLLARLAKEKVPERADRMATSPITHQQLADLVGTSRETITRIVKDLKDEGWLEQEGKRYLVPMADTDAAERA